MQKLKFYDFKLKKSFETDKYKVEERGNRCFAIATAPSGMITYRIISRVLYEELQ